MQLLFRMREIEKKGAVFFGVEDTSKMKFKPNLVNTSAQLSEKLQEILFNKRDEGYYFRKFHREKSLEGK
jgi:hypothetical protein